MTTVLTGLMGNGWLLILMAGLWAITKTVVAGILHFQRAEQQERETLLLMLTETQRHEAATRALKLPAQRY